MLGVPIFVEGEEDIAAFDDSNGDYGVNEKKRGHRIIDETDKYIYRTKICRGRCRFKKKLQIFV